MSRYILYPLLLSNVRWETISVDFIMKLPEFTGFDVVMTIIDSVFKKTHFIPIYMTITVEDAMRLFLYNIWKLHDLLTCVISDKRL